MEKEWRELVDRLSLVVAKRVLDPDFQGRGAGDRSEENGRYAHFSDELPRIAGDAVSESAIYFVEKVPHRSLSKVKNVRDFRNQCEGFD